MQIFITGLFSGPNPSPGVGVARSLREAYPDATLVGVDYSTRSTGLHAQVFDDLWLQRPWPELDLEEYACAIAERLDAGAAWLSGLDLETRWLAEALQGHPRLLSPGSITIKATEKPARALAEALGVEHPPTLSALASDWELHRFCREHGWRVWLKAPTYQATRVSGWREFLRVRNTLSHVWGEAPLHLQAHVDGVEESAVFAAWQGTLQATGHMLKRVVTEEGKTWAGAIEETGDVAPQVHATLPRVVSALAWSGGAELEFIRTSEGDLYLLECNPRFPAWIHGMTLSGRNLPAALVEAALAVRAQPVMARSRDFARVVLEVPVRAAYPLPQPVVSVHGAAGTGKHPSGMPALARLLNGPTGSARHAPPSLEAAALRELDDLMLQPHSTPAALLLTASTAERWRSVGALVRAASPDGGPEVRIAYSVKTNPDPRLMRLALDEGFLAEVISADEAAFARRVGFAGALTVLNGPAKSWPGPLPAGALVAFADSVREFERLVADSGARYVGLRLRPLTVGSRFGVDFGDFSTFAAAARAVQQLPPDQMLGLHFHYASSNLGWRRWREAIAATVAWAAALESLCDRRVGCLDLGGGWDPDDFRAVFLPSLASVIQEIRTQLPGLDLVILEPGKALAQPAGVVATQVLDVRQEASEIIVDASIAELPEASSYPHRVLRETQTGWHPLPSGSGRVLGRLCMEADVVATDVAIEGIKVNDRLVVADAGAYDSSMSYGFGRG